MQSDIETHSQVYYLYQNVIERCLGIATYLVKEKNLPIPGTAHETFLLLSQEGIITPKTATNLRGAYGFRNAIVHDYDDIKIRELVDNHSGNIENLTYFLTEINSYVEKTR